MLGRVVTVLAAVVVYLALKLSRPVGWLWKRLPHVHAGHFEARDVLSLILAGLAIYLSWQAIEMGEKQIQLADEQAGIVRTQFSMQQRQMQLEANVVVTYATAGSNRIVLSVYNRALVGIRVHRVYLTFESDDVTGDCSGSPDMGPIPWTASNYDGREGYSHDYTGGETGVLTPSAETDQAILLLPESHHRFVECELSPHPDSRSPGFLLKWTISADGRSFHSAPGTHISVPVASD